MRLAQAPADADQDHVGPFDVRGPGRPDCHQVGQNMEGEDETGTEGWT